MRNLLLPFGNPGSEIQKQKQLHPFTHHFHQHKNRWGLRKCRRIVQLAAHQAAFEKGGCEVIKDKLKWVANLSSLSLSPFFLSSRDVLALPTTLRSVFERLGSSEFPICVISREVLSRGDLSTKNGEYNKEEMGGGGNHLLGGFLGLAGFRWFGSWFGICKWIIVFGYRFQINVVIIYYFFLNQTYTNTSITLLFPKVF